MDVRLGPYDPCPCGSGAKYKFCCAAKAKANRHGKFPIGTVAHYGPDDKTTTKIAASVILSEDAEPIVERFIDPNVLNDPNVAEQIKKFFAAHGVKSVVATDGNMGCPHEEGIDFPEGQDCPLCPFWASKNRKSDATALSSEVDVAKPDITIADEIESGQNRAPDDAFARVKAILGNADMDMGEAIEKLCAYLQANLQLPTIVTGTEDFQWEEPYVIGGWSQRDYAKLKRVQPSYRDRYELREIRSNVISPWIMFKGEDIGALCRRLSDNKEFVLGLCELKVVDKSSPNYQLIDDYAVWFVNNR